MESYDELVEELATREVARTSLVDCAAYINPGYHIAWYHRLISQAIDRMFMPKEDPYSLRRLIITLPPRHGKSELLSRVLPPFIHGRDPNAQVIGCSYAATLAKTMCKDTQRNIINPRYKILFPNTRIMEQSGGTRRKATDNYTRTSDYYEIVDHKGFYLAAGVDGSITGKGFTWGIIDDPVKNAQEADSPVTREHTLKWYKSVFRNRAEGDARIIAIGTLWNIEDLISTLIRGNDSDLAGDKWYVIRLPAQAYGQLAEGDPRKDGEWLWPWKYSEAEYESLRVESGPRAWESLFQCNPTGEGSQEWDTALFEDDVFFLPKGEWPSTVQLQDGTKEEFIAGVISVDPSKGKDAKKGDYSAVTYLGRTNTKRVLGDAWGGRVSAEVLIDNIIEMAKTYRPQWIVGESNSFQNLILEALVKRLAREGLSHIRVIPVEHKEKKEMRIRRLGPIITKKGWKWKLNQHTRLLQQQLRMFPNSQHDDFCDSAELGLRYLVQLCNSRYNNPTTVLKV
jgi:predicted phage terminase large subunit-like protein